MNGVSGGAHAPPDVGAVLGHPEAQRARIGPNAVTQTVAALRAWLGDEEAALLLQTGTGRTFAELPTVMVHEAEANALMWTVRLRTEPAVASRVLHEAGDRTARYLLVNRMPRAAQWIIRMLPRRIGLRLLMAAIGRHAWTFAGSGRFTYVLGATATLRFDDCALCRGHAAAAPICEYYAATFERLLRELIDERSRVREVECTAAGGAACRFVMTIS